MSRIFWLASYPKSGNTWFRVFLQNVRSEADQPVNINELNTGLIASSRYWLDDVLGFDTADLTCSEIEQVRPFVYDWDDPESEPDEAPFSYHKTHDAYTYSAGGEPLHGRRNIAGALYILRNPLDIVPSLANHYQCSLDHAINLLGKSSHHMVSSEDKLNFQVRQRLLSWSEHIVSWVDAPQLNRLVIRYEDMLYRPLATFTRSCRFLAIAAERDRIEQAIHFSDFKELKRQEAQSGFNERPEQTESFFRKGGSGNWQQTLSEVQIQKIIEDHEVIMRRFGYLNERGEPQVVPLDLAND